MVMDQCSGNDPYRDYQAEPQQTVILSTTCEPTDPLLVDAGPCLVCGQPPRCHGLESSADGESSSACSKYVPDPNHPIKFPATKSEEQLQAEADVARASRSKQARGMDPQEIKVGKTYEGNPADPYAHGCAHYTILEKKPLPWEDHSMWLTKVNLYGEISYTQLEAFAAWAEKESVMPIRPATLTATFSGEETKWPTNQSSNS